MAFSDTATLTTVLSLKDGLTPGLGKSVRAVRAFDTGIGKAGRGVGTLAKGIGSAGTKLAAFAAVGLGASAKAAIDWQDAFQGVVKTVDEADLSKAGLTFDDLAESLRQMSREMPNSAVELAGIAEQAGALGIKAKDIEAFTRQVAILASTTNVSADEAATALGQLQNVIGLTGDEFDNFAASLVDLGNKGASTEAQILEIARRAGGAAKLFGIAKDETLGWASAAANLGINEELAGTSLQNAFIKLMPKFQTGAKALQEVTGKTAAQLKKSFKEDAGGALEDLIAQIGRMPKDQRLRAVQELFGKGSGITRLILGLADSYQKNLKPSLDEATDSWKKATAAQVEFDKRNATVRSAILRLKNNVIDAAVTIGEGFAPALGEAADELSKFLQQKDNRELLKGIGKDIGEAIRSIDFKKVIDGAKSFSRSIKPALDAIIKIAEAIASLPPEIIGTGGALLLANRLSGGALTSGIGGIVGGLGESLAKSLVAKVPLFGSAFVQPVFVTNKNFGLPGGGSSGATPGIAPNVGPAGIRELTGAGGAALIGVGVAQGLKEAGGFLGDAIFGSGSEGAKALDAWGDQARQAFGPLETIRSVLAGELPGKFDTMISQLKEITGNTEPTSGPKAKPDPTLERGSLVDFRASERASAGGNISVKDPAVLAATKNLRDQLKAALAREARAERNGNNRNAQRAHRQAEQLRQKIADQTRVTAARLTALRDKESQSIAAENRIHNAIDRKKLSVTVNTNVKTSTSIAISEVQRQARYSSRVAKTTQLAVR